MLKLLENNYITQPLVVIFGNYRCGSSALASALAIKTNRMILPEPLDEPMTNYQKFLDSMDTHQRAVAVIHPDQLHKLPAERLSHIKQYAYKIKLFRKNIIDQICSAYIARCTSIYNLSTTNKTENYDLLNIVLDDLTLQHAVSDVYFNRKLHNEQNIDYDEVVVYEDIQPYLHVSSIVKLPKIKNYQEVHKWIKQNVT